MKKYLLKSLSILALILVLQMGSTSVAAQCPMCKIGAESNLNNGGTAAKGLNTGILYMFATPYLVVGSIVFIWWFYRKEEEEDVIEGNA